MTGSDAPRIDTSRPHPARVYDWWLGGKDNYPVDEALARRILEVDGTVLRGARANRRFMTRAVRTAAEAGIRQFLDIGTGIPTEPNLHQVAQGVAPEAKVVYADNDPIVLRHAQALLHGSAEGATDYVEADVRDIDTLLGRARESLDFTQPVALSLVALTHYLDDDVYGLVARYVDTLAPGSYLILSQVTPDLSPTAIEKAAEQFRRSGTPFFPRSLAEFSRFFEGLELLGPGVIPVSGWRPAPEDVAAQAEGIVPVYAGVARKV
ncbi:SAM-dependent methyltransferase [Streptomyces sp. SAI-208]|jgi:SAM-dependent methyltransferase|uniref:SAM-dependent methyltransferase n=1 Tax=unclassified Streptomyces TaxID=2593676 RepID=UPI00247579C0|nr:MULTISPECIES: SAM-dependent methyltransferase [unclassified Streptomyces]MDH6515425.1 SAM-dependent methyltransferase [Streptomyces sp. SAI-090]MDH6606267.1 SAM-dependent methyltransferase [Streptomyces sp. SAI-208]MDH6620488.1 SAM-dependent methyltransferase [Streptomyces sp. SAI-135]